jgi:hypothetical protein
LDVLASHLLDCGALDEPAIQWAVQYQNDQHVPFDTALFELDLIDEQALLDGLATCFGIRAARPEDPATADPTLAQRLPLGFSRSFGICPLSIVGKELVALVTTPLPSESVQELRELFGLTAMQLVAPSHYVDLGRARVYAQDAGQRTLAVEARLAAKRTADVRKPLDAIGGVGSFASAAREVLDHAARLIEHACFLVCSAQGMRIVAATGQSGAAGQSAAGGDRTGAGDRPGTAAHDPARVLAAPGAACALGPAIRHGGFFLGRVGGTDADRALFADLGRSVPRAAFVAPVTSSERTSLVLCANNGERGIARRWVAELTLLAARLGQRRSVESAPRHSTAAASPEQRPTEATDAAVTPVPIPIPIPTPAPAAAAEPPPGLAVSEAEGVAIGRLRAAADKEGLALEAFVDVLLREHADRATAEVNSVVVGEVKGLFERLATDIPAHLARGMEAAFRDLVPRLAAQGPPPSAAVGATPAAAQSAAAPAVGLTRVESAPKEVPSYQSRRRKTPRVDL